MASVRRKERGSWLAKWRDQEGNLIEKATGEYEREEAQKKANQMEAKSRFWEDIEIFRLYAQLGYSPKYCHEVFIASKHIRFDNFKELLNDADIEFFKPSLWRDNRKKTGTHGKKYKYNGQLLTAPQIAEMANCQISITTLRYRLNKGWDVEKAVTTPLVSPQDSGRKGALISNAKRRK